MSLLSDLKNKGYRVFVDNFYTSPALFTDLHDNGFEACGTVRCDRKGLTSKFKEAKPSKGILLFYYTFYYKQVKCTVKQ